MNRHTRCMDSSLRSFTIETAVVDSDVDYVIIKVLSVLTEDMLLPAYQSRVVPRRNQIPSSLHIQNCGSEGFFIIKIQKGDI